MPKNQVTDPITDQEMAFARFVLAGNMTDRQAAEAAGLKPETAAYTKAKPRVRAYMLEHHAAIREQHMLHEAERLRQWNTNREQVLARLWDIANLDPEATRNSISGQVKALAMIIAIEGFIPRPHAAEKQAAPSIPQPKDVESPWLPEEEQSNPAPAQACQDPIPDEDQSGVAHPTSAATQDAPAPSNLSASQTRATTQVTDTTSQPDIATSLAPLSQRIAERPGFSINRNRFGYRNPPAR